MIFSALCIFNLGVVQIDKGQHTLLSRLYNQINNSHLIASLLLFPQYNFFYGRIIIESSNITLIYNLLNSNISLKQGLHMKLFNHLTFNLQFQQIHQRQKGLFTFYHEQLNQGTSFLLKKNHKQQISQSPFQKYNHQRNSQKYHLKPQNQDFQKQDQRNDLKKLFSINIGQKRTINKKNSKSLHKINIMKQLRKQDLRKGQSKQNIQAKSRMLNSKKKLSFKRQIQRQSINLNFINHQNLENQNKCKSHFIFDQFMLKKNKMVQKGVGNQSSSYVFPIFDLKKQETNKLRQMRQIRNRTNIQSKSQSIENKHKSVHNFPAQVLQDSIQASEELPFNKEMKKSNNSFIFTKMPSLRKKQQTLTNRLRQYMKNQSKKTANSFIKDTTNQGYQRKTNQLKKNTIYIKSCKQQKNSLQITALKLKQKKQRREYQKQLKKVH